MEWGKGKADGEKSSSLRRRASLERRRSCRIESITRGRRSVPPAKEMGSRVKWRARGELALQRRKWGSRALFKGGI
ncbi:hypothetical protein MRB53_026046 [Persea americana]|uniref:Uncharacterized protein n=1 Tax=Persea americana TaxID=3435 RepID=A0ACC2LH84_PERAE|nr:hypothetical protein MRB53_026046 [Persea americana]